MLNHQWLRTFRTLAATGQFTKTATALHMTQPGVSQHISKLEAQVGHELLEREGRHFDLTEAGKAVLAYAENIAALEDSLLRNLSEDSPHRGECRIACSGSLALLMYPSFLKYQQQYPELQLILEAAPNRRIRELILNDEMDMGIVTNQSSDAALAQHPIGKQALCLVLPASTKLRRAQSPSIDELLELGYVDHPDCTLYAEQVLASVFGNRYEGIQAFPRRGSINQITQILLAVAAGTGFTVLPEAAVRSFPHPEKILTARFTGAKNQALFETLYLVQRRRHTLPARYQWFISCFRQELAQ